MSAYISVGYLQPKPSRVAAGEAQVISGGQRATDERMPDWHYLSDVTIEWPLTVDLPGVREDCQLPDDAQVAVVLSWRSDRTNLRSGLPAVPVVDGENVLQAKISGSTLGGTLTIDAAVVLRDPGNVVSPLAPSLPGTSLWNKSERIVLEGAGGRFPTIRLDFETAGFPGDRHGLWYLDVDDSDFQANCTNALALYVNDANPDVKEVLAEGGAARASQLMKFMTYDVYRQLMHVAIRNTEFDDRSPYERASLGDMLVTLLRVFFRGSDIAQLRREFDHRPTDVEADLLARTWRLLQ